MRKLYLFALLSLISFSLFAQETGMNYKAIVSDNAGSILNNQAIDIQFTIYEGDPLDNNIVYVETHATTTDANGLVVLNIGEGNTTDAWMTIAWSDDLHFLKTEYDTGSGYVDMGTQAFKFVPYAHFSVSAYTATIAEEADAVDFSNVANTPTTLSGYGITDSFSGDYGDLTNVPSDIADGDDDTQLTETQVDNYVSNNGYLSLDPTDAVTLEIENTSTDGSTTGIDISLNSDNNNKTGIDITLAGTTQTASISKGIYIKNELEASQNQFGIYNQFTGSSTASSYGATGMFNYFSSDDYTGSLTGVHNSIYTDQDGNHKGVYNYINNTGDGLQYGVFNTLSGSGSGNKYGTYNVMSSTAGGTHFAVYGSATKADSYAGYFIGDVHMTQDLNVEEKVTAPESGDADMKAYMYGFIYNDEIKTLGSTDGFSFTKNATGDYTITFDTDLISYSRYIVIATLNSGLPKIITTQNFGDHFNVDIFDLNGVRVDDNFKFVIYKK